MDDHQRRLVKNEALFREVNERIEDVATELGGHAHLYEFLCECSNTDCQLRLPLTIGAYEQVRQHPRRFIVAPGHDLPDIEKVVERREAYQVIEKDAEPGRLAARLDPRE
jgi:hypothetical protein